MCEEFHQFTVNERNYFACNNKADQPKLPIALQPLKNVTFCITFCLAPTMFAYCRSIDFECICDILVCKKQFESIVHIKWLNWNCKPNAQSITLT